ncbi:MAG: hypothetical protein GBAus27B_000408 [Mycoplasmataceae bacterium]|nr:MAG: hypothetical protein GBAus27B_000408 [Mycoplasmataceae bacterium]
MKNTNQTTKNYTLEEKKLAYSLVASDLLNSLKKTKDGESIRLDSLGAFSKTKQKIKSSLQGKTYGKTYLYNRISFRLFPKAKAELDN